MTDYKQQITEVCKDALCGKCTADQMYKRLSAISDTADDDLVCIIEDCLMELDMLGGERRAGKQSAKECAKMVLEELENV